MPKLYLMLAAKLGSAYVTATWYYFLRTWGGLWRTVEAGHRKRPREAISEGAASAAGKPQHWRDHRERLKLGIMWQVRPWREARRQLVPLMKVATKDRSSCGVEPASAMRCSQCVCSGWQSRAEPRRAWVPNVCHWPLQCWSLALLWLECNWA